MSILAVVVLFAVLPLFVKSGFYMHVFTILFINVVLAMGMRLMMPLGMVSFAHAAFWGIGAYAAALLVMRGGLSFWLALPLAGVIAGAVAALVGYPGLRVRGTYFFLLTLAFNEFVRWIFILWVGVFGGISGLINIPAPGPSFVTSLVPYYYLTFVILLVAGVVMFRLHRARLGRVWDAVGQGEELASSLGVSPLRQKMIAFVTACFFAGLVGAVYGPYMTVLTPDYFQFFRSLEILVFTIVGGMGSPVGPIVGTGFMTLVSQVLRELREAEPLVYGVVLVLVLLFLPRGLVSLPQKIKAGLGRIRRLGYEVAGRV